MRVLNVLGASLVLVCALVVSFNHSISLFIAGGFGALAVWGVVGVETTFLLGALNIVVARMRHQSPGWPAYAAGALGTVLVGWSNVAAGLPYGWTGVLLGAAIPLALLISEGMLSRALLVAAINMDAKRLVKHLEKVYGKEVVAEMVAAITNTNKAPTPATPPAPAPEVVKEEKPPEPEKEAPAAKVVPPAPAPENRAPAKEKTAPAPATAKAVPRLRLVGSDEGDKELEQIRAKAEEIQENDKDKLLAIAKGDEKLVWVVAVALAVKKLKGKVPGRPTLAKVAGCNSNTARNALDALKKRKAG